MKSIHECEYISIVFEYECEKNMNANANTEYEYPCLTCIAMNKPPHARGTIRRVLCV